MRDQTAALYKWEDAWSSWNASTCSLAECRKFVRMACEAYGVPPPPVATHKHTEMSYFDPARMRISLRYDHKNVPIALHEAAHAIVWHYYGASVPDHGKEFMGIYLYLLAQARCAPEVALTASARAAGLRWLRDMSPERVSKLPRVVEAA